MRTLLGNIIQANKIFKMIEDGDKIAVGVSGGKDSMGLLFALALYKRRLKEQLGWNIDVIGIHLKMNLCAIDYDPIIAYWEKMGIKFVIQPTQMGEILRDHMKKGKIQCSLCSKMKKAILIESAKSYGCNKVAMGHHADDAIETLFMNMINEGRIATFKPKMYLNKTEITFIRPLILAREKDIKRATKKLEMPIVPCGCPMEGFTQRDSMKELLQSQFYDKLKTKSSYENFFISLMNGKECSLWFMDEDKKIINEDLREMCKNDGKVA
ncbi:tRNA 2-thiocytidine biosynthesis TtcA family protein [Ureaplasma ceti]|uniref:tRNA 2-thiocytidine(32) synthetase TtcA n=1 Tax=Ureaplasma ceti TaxID=3119530 RepID=A0ABP9U5X4_9BACT